MIIGRLECALCERVQLQSETGQISSQAELTPMGPVALVMISVGEMEVKPLHIILAQGNYSFYLYIPALRSWGSRNGHFVAEVKKLLLRSTSISRMIFCF